MGYASYIESDNYSIIISEQNVDIEFIEDIVVVDIVEGIGIFNQEDIAE